MEAKKIPSPNRNEMMVISNDAQKSDDIDSKGLKSLIQIGLMRQKILWSLM